MTPGKTCALVLGVGLVSACSREPSQTAVATPAGAVVTQTSRPGGNARQEAERHRHAVKEEVANVIQKKQGG